MGRQINAKCGQKDFSSCGIFSVLRAPDAPKIRFEVALEGIQCVSRSRGSPWGAGFGMLNLDGAKPDRYRLKAFVRDHQSFLSMRDELVRAGIVIAEERLPQFNSDSYARWIADVIATEAQLKACIDRAHFDLHGDIINGRFYSAGRFGEVFKDIGYPIDIARIEGIAPELEADLWLGHTRVPTNSLGNPVRSHPFSIIDLFLIHNGELSSFGANRRFLEARGVKSFVGTDSEVASMLFYHLVKERGLTVQQAAAVLSPPFEQHWDKVAFPGTRDPLAKLLYHYRGAQLDGPYSMIVGYADGNDVYMIGLCDRSKFRPMIIGVDRQNNVYVASEEWQIKNVAPDAQVWTPEPGRTLIASVKQGIIQDARGARRGYMAVPQQYQSGNGKTNGAHATIVDAHGRSYHDVNKDAKAALVGSDAVEEVIVEGVLGQRFLAIGTPPDKTIRLRGLPGNSAGKLGTHGTTLIVEGGNAEDDFADASHAKKIVVRDGDVRDVAFYAAQVEEAYVWGRAGNRTAILARTSDSGKPSAIVIGKTLDYYGGEFMADGVLVVLDLDNLDNEKEHSRAVGEFLASGIVGNAAIYVRGNVRPESISVLPDRSEVIGVLEELVADDYIDRELCRTIQGEEKITWSLIQKVITVDEEVLTKRLEHKIKADELAAAVAAVRAAHEQALRVLKPVFWNKYREELSIEYRKLDDRDTRALEGITGFCEEFKGRLPDGITQRLQEGELYTVVRKNR